MALDRGPHPVEVVLDQEEDRQLPQRRQVHRLAEVAGVGGAVAEHADGDRVFALVLGGEGEAGGDRQVAADDPVAAHEAVLGVEDVHRAAAPAAGPVDPAEELGHHPLRARCRGRSRGRGCGRCRSGSRRSRITEVVPTIVASSPIARCRKPPALRPLVLAPRLLLEAADQRHPRKQLVTGGGVRQIGHRTLTLARAPPPPPRAGRRPRRPVADDQRRDAFTPSSAASSVASRRAPLTAVGFDRLQQRPRVQLAGGARRSARCRRRSGRGRRRRPGGRRRGRRRRCARSAWRRSPRASRSACCPATARARRSAAARSAAARRSTSAIPSSRPGPLPQESRSKRWNSPPSRIGCHSGCSSPASANSAADPLGRQVGVGRPEVEVERCRSRGRV